MGLGNRLALLGFVIVLGAMAIVYVGVVPSLEDSLRRQALRQLRDAGRPYAMQLQDGINKGRTSAELSTMVRQAADDATVRVTLLNAISTPGGPQISTKSDSTGKADLQFAV